MANDPMIYLSGLNEVGQMKYQQEETSPETVIDRVSSAIVKVCAHKNWDPEEMARAAIEAMVWCNESTAASNSASVGLIPTTPAILCIRKRPFDKPCKMHDTVFKKRGEPQTFGYLHDEIRLSLLRSPFEITHEPLKFGYLFGRGGRWFESNLVHHLWAGSSAVERLNPIFAFTFVRVFEGLFDRPVCGLEPQRFRLSG